MSKKPNLFIVGAPRTATTSFYHLLKTHPDVYMSKEKEPHYFMLYKQEYDAMNAIQKEFYDNSIVDLNKYESLFSDVKNEKVIGEASTLYLYSPWVPQEIKDYNPDAKIIIVLRNPIKRAYSNFSKDYRHFEGDKIKKFEEVIAKEDLSKKEMFTIGEHYLRVGFYSEQIEQYIKVFGKDNVFITFYEEFNEDPHKILKDMCEFLEIDSNFEFEIKFVANQSGTPKSKVLDNVLNSSKSFKYIIKKTFPDSVTGKLALFQNKLAKFNLKKEELNEELFHSLLMKYYKEEYDKLESLGIKVKNYW